MPLLGFRHRPGAGLPCPWGGVGWVHRRCGLLAGGREATPRHLTLGRGCAVHCPSLVGGTEQSLCPVVTFTPGGPR